MTPRREKWLMVCLAIVAVFVVAAVQWNRHDAPDRADTRPSSDATRSAHPPTSDPPKIERDADHPYCALVRRYADVITTADPDPAVLDQLLWASPREGKEAWQLLAALPDFLDQVSRESGVARDAVRAHLVQNEKDALPDDRTEAVEAAAVEVWHETIKPILRDREAADLLSTYGYGEMTSVFVGAGIAVISLTGQLCGIDLRV